MTLHKFRGAMNIILLIKFALVIVIIYLIMKKYLKKINDNVYLTTVLVLLTLITSLFTLSSVHIIDYDVEIVSNEIDSYILNKDVYKFIGNVPVKIPQNFIPQYTIKSNHKGGISKIEITLSNGNIYKIDESKNITINIGEGKYIKLEAKLLKEGIIRKYTETDINGCKEKRQCHLELIPSYLRADISKKYDESPISDFYKLSIIDQNNESHDFVGFLYVSYINNNGFLESKNFKSKLFDIDNVDTETFDNYLEEVYKSFSEEINTKCTNEYTICGYDDENGEPNFPFYNIKKTQFNTMIES